MHNAVIVQIFHPSNRRTQDESTLHLDSNSVQVSHPSNKIMHDGSIQQLDSNSVQISHQQQDHARQINAASMQQQRASLSPEQQDHPCLKLYIGAHVMVNNNDLLKSHGIGNGSMGRVKRVQLKSTATNPGWKNWEGKKVYCVSVNDVEYIEIERCRRDSYNQRT